MNKKQYSEGNLLIIVLLAAAVLIGGGVLYYKGAKTQKDALEAPLPPPAGGPEDVPLPPPPKNVPPMEIGAEDEMLEDSSGGTSGNEVVAVTGKNFEFSTKEIRVKKGDFVRINFTSADGMHDWHVETYNVGTATVGTGKSSSVEFIADKEGTFEFYCSVGSHRQMGMVGKLIVE